MSEHHLRRLVIMRHAKADWPGGVADHERPLEERGHREAPLAGRWLLKHKIVPDFILCSSALRTRQTCTWVCSELGDKAPRPSSKTAFTLPPRSACSPWSTTSRTLSQH
jgi:phosphohistidine phosphatase